VLAVLASFAPTLSNDFVDGDDDLNLTNNQAYRGLSPALFSRLENYFGIPYPYAKLDQLAVPEYVFGAMDPAAARPTSFCTRPTPCWCDGPAGAPAALALARDRTLRWVSGVGASSRSAAAGQSVAWATERRDVLSGCFWLLALLAYLRATAASDDRSGRGHGLALAALALSLAAKAWGMTFPLVLLILDAYPLRRLARDPRAVLREKVPYAALALLAAVARLRRSAVPEMRSLRDHGLAARARKPLRAHVLRRRTIVPAGLHPAICSATPSTRRHLATSPLCWP
jgi:hypothetical protein